MTVIKIKATLLKSAAKLNFFSLPKDKWVVVGLRGCVPVKEVTDPLDAQELELKAVDFQHFRCSIGLWNMQTDKVIFFLGSTSPHRRYMKKQIEGLLRANQMMQGFYKYRKGTHRPKTAELWHEALRQDSVVGFRRSYDDFDYEGDDLIDSGNVGDNIHAAFQKGRDSTRYGSAGCQVISGIPQCGRHPASTGDWAKFSKILGDLGQQVFQYMLLNGAYLHGIEQQGEVDSLVRLRFGSRSPYVTELQKKLHQGGYHHDHFDTKFGSNTLKALYEFQKKEMAVEDVDGVVGPKTADKLGMELKIS